MGADEGLFCLAMRVAIYGIGHVSIFAGTALPVNDLCEESQLRHRVALAIARPQSRIVLNGCGCDQGVRDFQAVTLCELTQERSGQLTDFVVRGYADERAEEDGDELVFVRERARPDFCSDNWGVKNNRSGSYKTRPF